MKQTILTLLLIAVVRISPGQGNDTSQDPRVFVEDAEKRLMRLFINWSRASWVQNNFITFDTELLAADAQKDITAVTAELVKASKKFDGRNLPGAVDRKLKLLKLSLPVPAPNDPAEQSEMTQIAVSLESDYSRAKFTLGTPGSRTYDLTEASRLMANSRNADTLFAVWKGWHESARPLRKRYRRLVEIANKGAAEMGFADLGALWRSNYDMAPDEFAREVTRLWLQVKPLYDALHAYTRSALAAKYGSKLVDPAGLIPAHLLGNMWAQNWTNIYELVEPPKSNPGYDLTTILRSKKVDEMGMVRFGERFFTSLGFDPLPGSFWERSLFKKPSDREVVCHASAWSIDNHDDLRIKMCIEITEEDFYTIHHELGHNFYQRAYKDQPFLFQDSANDGFHEALGDAVALFVTPEYLKQIGLIEQVPDASGDLGLLMKMALDKIAFLPFGLLIDTWRWKVFSGEVKPSEYNKTWWQLRERYQGIKAPVARSEEDFDPGAKFHIPASVPYARYFLATILQFQIHRALARETGFTGPLHRTSLYGNKEAGTKLEKMMQLGKSRPWPEALEAVTGERQLDATAILHYFAPLKKWLDEQNKGKKVGF